YLALRYSTPTLFPYTTLFRSDHAGDGLRPRSGAREEAPRRRGLRERLPDRHLRLPAPRLSRGAGDGRGDRRLLAARGAQAAAHRSEEHTSELQSRSDLVCRLL